MLELLGAFRLAELPTMTLGVGRTACVSAARPFLGALRDGGGHRDPCTQCRGARDHLQGSLLIERLYGRPWGILLAGVLSA